MSSSDQFRTRVSAGLSPVFVGDRRLGDFSPFHIERWKTARAKEVKPATVNRELNIVRGCFSRAVEWGRLGSSPMKGVKPYKVDNVRTRGLSLEGIETLLSACPRGVALLWKPKI